MPSVTAIAHLAEFTLKTTLGDCPPEALAVVRRAALDTLGVMLAGAAEPPARAVRALARAEGGAPLCTVAGTDLRTSPTWAALANGTAAHAHDFDDTSFAWMGHPSAPLLAALLAAGEAELADGAALVTGYVVGFEVGAALGEALNPSHYARGWHATATLGTLACAAAAARVMRLDAPETRHALGLAASLASGLRENFGTMTKPLHVGLAARNGLLAAALAREGVTASARALDGARGFAAAFGDAADDRLAAALERLGRRWRLLDPGIAVKAYPSCAQTHAAIDALLELRAAYRPAPDEIAEVLVGVDRLTPGILIYPEPTTGLERKFSMPFCAAAALADGRVDLASFEAEPAPAVRTLMPRVRMVVDDAIGDDPARRAWARVTVRLRDGRTLGPLLRGPAGHPERPLSDAALRAKFLACAGRVLAPAAAAGLAEAIEHLEAIPDVRALTARLTGPLD